ncbi:hypothetical protein [Jeotgalibaca sp. A122]|uniref:hypothetical protein n=1 Tax=Jeotgalibaca sp. A122 TaxID=3457322 RepID=UPI003FD3DD34
MSRGLRGHPPPTSHQGSEQFREFIYHVFLKMMTVTDELCPVYEMTLRRYFNEFVDWGIFMSVPYLHLRMEEDADFKRKIQQLQVGLETLRQMFDLPETDFHYLILQLHNAMESYRLCPPGFSPKRYLLFPTFNVGLNDIVKQKIPLFYQEAKQMLIQICHERELVLQKDDLDYLLYIQLSWWENLAFDFMEKFNSCRILVSSHLTLNHAKAITATLQTELSRHYTFEVLPGDCLSKENLEKLQFDLLIVTKTTALEIEQPVLYMDGSAMHDRLRLLRQLTDEVVEKNKQKYFDKVKATCELLIK